MKAMQFALFLAICMAFALGQSPVSQSSIPDKIKIGALENIFKPVLFDHKLHADMTVMGQGCPTCHHFAEDDVYGPCADCHDTEAENASLSMPTLNGAYHRNCLNCHRDWSGDHVCETCHEKQKIRFNTRRKLDATDVLAYAHKEIPIPDVLQFVQPTGSQKQVTFHHKEHIELYRIKCEQCHRQTDCSACHNSSPLKTGQIMTLQNHHDPCIACHETDTSESCTSCHRDKPSQGFTHALTGWELNRFHAPLPCNRCHVGTDPITALESRCETCHQNFTVGDFDHAITGLQLNNGHEEIDCTDCHDESSNYLQPGCVECHEEDLSYPTDLPGIKVHQN